MAKNMQKEGYPHAPKTDTFLTSKRANGLQNQPEKPLPLDKSLTYYYV